MERVRVSEEIIRGQVTESVFTWTAVPYQSVDVAWILSRSETLNVEVEEKVNAIVDKYLQKSQLRTTKQDAET